MYLSSINWFRGIAIFFVVLGHVPLTVYAGTDFNYNFLSNGSFFFVLISGFLFHYLKERYEYTDFMIKKFKYVVFPYLFIITPGVILAAYYYINGMEWFNADSIPPVSNLVYYVFYLITHGGTVIEPLWFIPMICIFFILSPLIKKIMESKYFGIITIICLAFTLTTSRPNLPELSFIHWLGVYLLGGYLSHKYSIIRNNSVKIFFLSLIILAFSAFIDFDLINSSHVNKLITTFSFISLLCILEDKKFKLAFLDLLAKYSFGIFFIHGYIIQVMKRGVIPFFGQGITIWFLTIAISLLLPILIVKTWSTLLSSRRSSLNTRYFFGV